MITPLPQYAMLHVQGPDACSFLQGQLTCNMNKINEQQASLAAYCNAKGRILASMYVLYHAGCYCLILRNDLLEATLKHLHKYATFSQVTIQPADEHWLCLGAIHRRSESLHPYITTTFPTQPTHFLQAISTPHGHIIHFTTPKATIHRYWILLDRTTYTHDQQKKLGAVLTKAHTLWQSCLIKEGLAEITANTQGLFTPHKINLHKLDAIDFNKGCFVGQEVIARTEHLARPQDYLHQAVLQLPRTLPSPQPGDVVVNQANTTVGHIVNTAVTEEPLHTSHELLTLQLLLIAHPKAITTEAESPPPLFLKQHPLWPLRDIVHIRTPSVSLFTPST